MANRHHQRVPLQTLTLAFALFLPCIACLAAISLWTITSRLVPSSSLQPLYHSQRQLKDTEEEDEIYRPRPCYDLLCPGAASLQGRRPYQEDRVLFSPGLRLPLPTADESSSPAGLFGVFDGHLGEAASDFAAKSVRERFLYHSFKGWQGAAPTFNLSSIVQSMPLFEAALLAAISDINSTFGEIAVHQGLKSGSTACIALQVGNRILVANVGDSKAFFCSSCEGREPGSAERLPDSDLSQAAVLRASRRARHRTSRMYEEDPLYSKSQGLCARHLSSDHRPDRPDEKLRIEASGGFVSNGSLPRVNGQLAVSRSIGDVDLRKYGVISEPELSGWRQVSEDDKFLILGSDGIFEKLSPQEVCHVMHAISSGQDVQAIIDKTEKQSSGVIALPGVVSSSNSNEKVGDMPRSGPHSITSTSAHIMSKESHLRMAMPYFKGPSGVGQVLAQILVELAFRAGSMDNLSAVVVPLKVVAG